MPYFVVFIVIFLCVWFAWKWWGKKLTNYFYNEPSIEKRKDTLENKIETLKSDTKDLKDTDEELEVSVKLEKVKTELGEKQEKIDEIDGKLK